MKTFLALAAVLLLGGSASAQQCANGQCQRPQAVSQASYAAAPQTVSAPPVSLPTVERKGLIERIRFNREERQIARANRRG